tara:strand:- start:66 stop:491 length:426 start_codon:yes stop_codon:yes gene_type:complete
MAKIFTGKDGRLLLDDLEQVKVTNWSLTGNLEMLETTSLGDNQRTYCPGLQEFSGSATLLYYNDDVGRNDASTALRKVLRVDGVSQGDTVDMRLRLLEGSTNRDVQLTAYITSVSFGASVGEVSSAEINFQGTGALTAVTV